MMKEKKVKAVLREIKEEYAEISQTDTDGLRSFADKYAEDERQSVKQLVCRARKGIAALAEERQRLYDLGSYEREYAAYSYICGIDEAGRGPLAGPVVAGAVILPKDCDILYINDSKKLSAQKRELLYDEIMEKAVSASVGCVSHQRIDEINILQATYEAMREAVAGLSVQPDLLLNDAVTIPRLAIKQVPIVHGDAKSISIGAASIIAKVTRDRMMLEYDSLFPEYGFRENKGYGSRQHIRAIQEYGPCPIHRQTFITHFTGNVSEKTNTVWDIDGS